MKLVDIFDINKEGSQQWENAVKEYESRIDRVESQITLKLRDKLGAAKNATEMFRVCSNSMLCFFDHASREPFRNTKTI